jgi:hypothetical protein
MGFSTGWRKIYAHQKRCETMRYLVCDGILPDSDGHQRERIEKDGFWIESDIYWGNEEA